MDFDDEPAVYADGIKTPSDVVTLVKSIFRLATDDWDKRLFRNAGEIEFYQMGDGIEVAVPLPYFHHASIEPEILQSWLDRRFSSSVEVSVRVADPPDREREALDGETSE